MEDQNQGQDQGVSSSGNGSNQEEMELAGLTKIQELAQSGSPQALPQILQIVEALINAQKQEMSEQGGGEEQPSIQDRVKARLAGGQEEQ